MSHRAGKHTGPVAPPLIPRQPLAAEQLFPKTNVEIDLNPPFELRPAYTGRVAALAELEEAFAHAVDGSGLTFSVLLGAAGMGKSRTLRELARSVVESDPEVRFLVGTCEAADQPHAAFSMLLASRFGVRPGDRTDVAHEKILTGVSEVVNPGRVTEIAHLLAHLMRRPFEGSPVVGSLAHTPQQLSARVFLAMRRFLQADAAAGPLVLCLENLEQADTGTINLLHFLVAGLEQSPVMMVGTATPELFDRHQSFGDCDVPLRKINLGPLSGDEAEQLLRELCRNLSTIPTALIKHARSLGGSPRVLFELVRLLLESGAIVRGPGGWRVDPLRMGRTPLPRTPEEVVAARVRAMEPAEREILQKAAIVGEAFWLDAVVALVRADKLPSDDPDGPTLAEIAAAGDHTKARVTQTLTKLVNREWLVEVETSSMPGEREYRFSYPYLWATVYDQASETHRKRAHQRVAQWLELRPDGRDADSQEDIARHLELAGDARGAAARYRRAANHARVQFFNDKAILLYTHGLNCLGEADQAARIHLWHDLGSVYELKGEYDAAIGAFERMLRLSWVCASRTKAAVAFNKMGRVWRKKGDLQLSLDYLRRGLQLFEQADDDRGIAGSLDDIGQVEYLLGNFDDAHQHVTEGLARRGKRGDQRSIAQSLSTLGNIQQDRGRINEALNCHRESLDLRRSIGDRLGVASSLNNLACIAFDRGNIGEAREGWEQALKEAEDIGALPLQALILCNLGEVALNEHRHEEARRRLAEGINIANEIADRRLEVEATRNMARLEYVLSNSSEARDLAQRAHDIAAQAGLRDYEGRTLLTLAEVFGGALFDANRTDEFPVANSLPAAEGYYQQGIQILREIGSESELAKGLDLYGRYKIEQGQRDEGRLLLLEALAIFQRLGMQKQVEVQQMLASI